jgi:hypothetical protein
VIADPIVKHVLGAILDQFGITDEDFEGEN